MPLIIARKELEHHVPEMRDGIIVGCAACPWTSVIWAHAGSTWYQFLNHLPTFREEGMLILSDSDEEWLAKIDKAHQGEVVRPIEE